VFRRFSRWSVKGVWWRSREHDYISSGHNYFSSTKDKDQRPTFPRRSRATQKPYNSYPRTGLCVIVGSGAWRREPLCREERCNFLTLSDPASLHDDNDAPGSQPISDPQVTPTLPLLQTMPTVATMTRGRDSSPSTVDRRCDPQKGPNPMVHSVGQRA
jgi:hypothetical protein